MPSIKHRTNPLKQKVVAVLRGEEITSEILPPLKQFNSAIAYGSDPFITFFMGGNHLDNIYRLNNEIYSLKKEWDLLENLAVKESEHVSRQRDIKSALNEKIALYDNNLEEEKLFRQNPDFLLLTLDDAQNRNIISLITGIKAATPDIYKATYTVISHNYNHYYANKNEALSEKYLENILNLKTFHEQKTHFLHSFIDDRKEGACAFVFNVPFKKSLNVISFIKCLYPDAAILYLQPGEREMDADTDFINKKFREMDVYVEYENDPSATAAMNKFIVLHGLAAPSK